MAGDVNKLAPGTLANPESGSGERWFIAVSAAAAVTCAAIMFVLLIQTNRSHLQLQNDGMVEFNVVQQLDHDLDAVTKAALQLRTERAVQDRAPSPLTPASDLVRHFAALHGARTTIDVHQEATLRDVPEAAHTLEGLRQFITGNEALIRAGVVVDNEQLQRIANEGQLLSAELYELGLGMYRDRSVLRGRNSSRMNWLSRASWFFGASFLLAGLTLYLLLTRASRRAARLFYEARSSQYKLETALKELTSGNIQRKSQNRFLAAATHDLRQPLQAMQYYIAALEPHVADRRGQEILANVGRSTDAAQSLLTALLDISRLDAGVLDPEPAAVNLDDLLDRLHADFQAEAESRGLLLHIEPSGIWVHTDAQFLERILVNLLGNALTYTQQGSVRLFVQSDPGGTTRINVVDTGVGIPEHELETIFNEYYQIDSADSRPDNDVTENPTRQGMGLGLSIVRRLTRLIDAPLEVSSKTGRGTRFTITLPTVEPSRKAIADSAAKRTSSSDRFDGLYVMIIDDEPSVRDGVVTLLKQRGCEVTSASSIDEGLHTLIEAAAVPDLILADYQLLHGTTGVEAIELVREEVNEEVPAILITGDTSPDRLGDARRGGYGLLHKPVGSTALFAAITMAIEGVPAQSGQVVRPADVPDHARRSA